MIAYAQPHHVFRRSLAEGEAGNLHGIDGGGSKVVVVIFDPPRPNVGEGVFDAGAGGPAEALNVEIVRDGDVRRAERPVVLLNRRGSVDEAAGQIIQRSPVRVAGARPRHPAQIIRDIGLRRPAERGAEAVVQDLVGVLAGEVEIRFRAEHELAELLIVAEMEAAEGAARTVVLRIGDGIGEVGVAGNGIEAAFLDGVEAIAGLGSKISALPAEHQGSGRGSSLLRGKIRRARRAL